VAGGERALASASGVDAARVPCVAFRYRDALVGPWRSHPVRRPITAFRSPGASRSRAGQAQLFFYSHQFIKTAIDVSKTDFIQWRSHSIDIEKVCLSIVLQIYLYALNKRLLVFCKDGGDSAHPLPATHVRACAAYWSYAGSVHASPV
jgi:hypothetical protein